MLRMTWKVQVCPKTMRSPGKNGEGELRGNRLTQVHLEKWPLKRSVCGHEMVTHGTIELSPMEVEPL